MKTQFSQANTAKVRRVARGFLVEAIRNNPDAWIEACDGADREDLRANPERWAAHILECWTADDCIDILKIESNSPTVAAAIVGELGFDLFHVNRVPSEDRIRLTTVSDACRWETDNSACACNGA